MSYSFSVRQMARIVLTIGWSDFLLKYRGTVLGYMWSFAVPLMKLFVIYHIFRPFVSDTVPLYPLYLFLGLLLWEHFVLVTTGCIGVLHEKRDIIVRVPLPRLLWILTVGWTNLIITATHLLIFIVFAWWLDVSFSAASLLILLVMFQLECFSLGVGMILSAFSLRYRDISHMWQMVLQILFWLTPIAYGIRETSLYISVPSLVNAFIRFQPLTILIDDARRVLLYVRSLGVPSVEHMLLATAFTLCIFLFGVWIFTNRSKRFLQEY